MLRKLLPYITVILLGLSISGCTAEDIGILPGTGEIREFKGTITFDLSTPDASGRTRSLDTESGSSVLVNNLWIGVFDVETGRCFGARRYDEFNRTMISGSLVKNILKVDFVAYGEDVPLGYVVAVANYDGVTTHDGRRLEDLLPDFDRRGEIDWDFMINLDIDAASAYAGNKGADDNANAPFLAGFFQDAVSLNQNPKIDQFAYTTEGPSAIYPSSAADGMDIRLGDADGNTFVAAGAICLRRLVSHNILRFNTSNGYEVTGVKYRRFNMPKAVYMLQRRTDTNRRSSFAEWQANSPNFADHLLTEGHYDSGAPDFPYQNDVDWVEMPVNWWDDAGALNVEFDHFENKHRGFGNLSSQEDRERLNPDGTFAALCQGSDDAYNNFASYFVLGLHIVNKQTGESADVEYTLHEGFCNTDDGRRAETLQEKCLDFASFRNVNYTYNINIAGISDITASVTADEGFHTPGQTGSVWQMNFATGRSKTPAAVKGGDYDFGGTGLSLSNTPDLGFRIYGPDGKGGTADICFNMPEDMYGGFYGLWPDGTPLFTDDIDAAIPPQLLSGILVGNSAGYYTVVDFVKGIRSGAINAAGKYSFRFTDYSGDPAGMMRGLYIFDRNDIRNSEDADGCSTYRVAYGGYQYPSEPGVVKFDPANILWDNKYYKEVSSASYVYTSSANIFYGAETSVIPLRWNHDSRFQGYRITVYNDNYTHPGITVGPDRIRDYLHTVNGRQVFEYPLNTSTFPRSNGLGANNYNFSITPIVDEELYTAETTVVALANDANCIRVCPTTWEFSSSNDLKDLDLKNKEKVEVYQRGLTIVSVKQFSQGVKGSYLSFGGVGSASDRYISFTAAVPGRFEVTVKSHSSSADAARQLVVARMSPTGALSNPDGSRYDRVYESKEMAGSQTAYTTGVLGLNPGNTPTEFRLFTEGSTDFYKIRFIPAN